MTSTTLVMSVTNNSGKSLKYTPVLISYPKNRGGDIELRISDERGKPMPLCGMLDTDRMPEMLVLAPGSIATFSEGVTSLVLAHCLSPGSKYMMWVEYASPGAAPGASSAIQSNEIEFRAPEDDGNRT